jgi:hypothetical protein
LHIKFGLTKHFVKAIDQNSAGFMYLKNKFPRISDAEINEGIFVGTEIRKLIPDVKFDDQLREVEKPARKSLKNLSTNFLGNHKAETYRDMVADFVQSHKAMGCNMSLNVHSLDSHLNFFPENLGAVSDEHGERFHQDSFTMEKQYQGKWSPSMLADYCWTLRTDVPQAKYSRKSSTVTFRLYILAVI